MIILPDDLNKEVNKKIDVLIYELVRYGEKEVRRIDYNVDKIYEILENIKIWEKIRGYKNINVDLECSVNKLFFEIFKDERFLENE